MTILGTEMHLMTFPITMFESVLFFIQLIYFLSRPNDQNRMRYWFLLFLLIYYNIVSGLLPDQNIHINIFVQNLLAYSSGIIVSMYFVYYIYKTFELTSLKKFAYRYSIVFLLGSFLVAFAFPYLFTGDLELSRKLIVIMPFGFTISFIYVLTKALRKRYIEHEDYIVRQEIKVSTSVLSYGAPYR